MEGRALILLVVVMLLVACDGYAAVTIDAVSSEEGIGVNTASTSHSHTIASDANLVVVCLAERDTSAGGITADTATVTVGGAAATQLSAVQESTPQVRVVMFYKLSPSTGVQTIAATSDSGIDRLLTGVLSLKGVAGSSTFNTAGTSSNIGSTDADVDGLASAVGEFAVLCGASATAASTASADATAPVSTEQLDVAVTDATTVRGWIYTEAGDTTSINMRVDLASSVRWAATAVSIRGAQGNFGPLRRR